MNENVIIGVDIGTTSTKTVAFSESGSIFSETAKEYPLYSKPAGTAEQDPDEIYEAVIATLRTVVYEVKSNGHSIAAVSFSAAMHSLIALDQTGNPLTNSITWADQRSVQEAKALRSDTRGLDIYKRTGTPIHPMSPLTKLIWFKKNDPALFEAAHKWVSIKDYVFYRLFHDYIVDYSIASATGLFHLENLDWDEEALNMAGISKDQLSRPVKTTHIVKGLQKDAAEQTGLAPSTPFIIGASDGVLANLGVAAIEPGSVACSVGTSGAVRTVIPHPITDNKGRLFCYALTEDHWVIGGPVNNGGIAFRWLRDNVFDDLSRGESHPYEVLNQRAERVKPGAGGLIFLPYLTGERAPFWNADLRGAFFGLNLNHTRNDMIRSVMEGVMFQLDMVVDTLKQSGVEPKEFRVSGGFTKSKLWPQIMADIFEKDILVPEGISSACFGAALLGMKALELIENFTDITDKVEIKQRHHPNPENVAVYKDYKPLFKRLAGALQNECLSTEEIHCNLVSQS